MYIKKEKSRVRGRAAPASFFSADPKTQKNAEKDVKPTKHYQDQRLCAHL